jgi:hypothetical protein
MPKPTVSALPSVMVVASFMVVVRTVLGLSWDGPVVRCSGWDGPMSVVSRYSLRPMFACFAFVRSSCDNCRKQSVSIQASFSDLSYYKILGFNKPFLNDKLGEFFKNLFQTFVHLITLQFASRT